MRLWISFPFFLICCLALGREEPKGEALHESGAHEHGTHFECPLPKKAQDVVLCARENHPDVRRVRLRVERAKAQPDAVSQTPNPSLQVQSV